jgi:hypothetical protein
VAGKWLDKDGQVTDVCKSCVAGKYFEQAGQLSDVCKSCVAGKYSEQAGQQSDICVNCAAGKSHTVVGSAAEGDCTPSPTFAPTKHPTEVPSETPSKLPTKFPTSPPTNGGVFKIAITIDEVKCTARDEDIAETLAAFKTAIAASVLLSEKQVDVFATCHGDTSRGDTSRLLRALVAQPDDLKVRAEIRATSRDYVEQVTKITENKQEYENTIVTELAKVGIQTNTKAITYAPEESIATYPTKKPTFTGTPSKAPSDPSSLGLQSGKQKMSVSEAAKLGRQISVVVATTVTAAVVSSVVGSIASAVATSAAGATGGAASGAAAGGGAASAGLCYCHY